MQKLIFVLISTLLLIKPSANAIFLSSLGIENLPLAYLGVAFVAFFVTSFYGRFINTISPKVLFIRSMIICIVLLIVLGTFMWFSWAKQLSAILFYLFMSIFGILSASQFWIMANQVFNAREARKYFGIIGLGAIGGGIFGGYLASVLSSFVQSEMLLFVAAGMLLFSLRYIRQINVEFSNGNTSFQIPHKTNSILHPFQLIKKSQHLKYLAVILALSVFVAKMIDYQFGYFATLSITEEENLTSFFGFWYSSFNLISLLIQLFLTTRIVGRFGVGYSLLILPVILIINVSALLIIPLLVVALMMKLSDASMKQSINKSAMELMMLPIPEDIKLRTKTFLDVFIDSLATGVSGLILLFVIKAFDLPNFIITIVILLAVIAWGFYANKMRTEYKSVFRQSLRIQSKKSKNENLTIYEGYDKVLNEGSTYQVLKALKLLKDQPLTGLEKTISKLLKQKDSKIVQAALEAVMYDSTDYSIEALNLLEKGDQNVKITAFEYLINHQQKLKPAYLINLLNKKNPSIQLTAIAAFAKEFQNDPKTMHVLRLKDRLDEIIKMANEKNSEGVNYIIGTLKAIGYGKFPELYGFIEQQIQSQNPLLVHHAFLAAGETKSSKFLRLLMGKLGESDVKSISMALAKFGSKRIRKVMEKLLKDRDIGRLREIPMILENIPDQMSIHLLQILSEVDDMNIRNNSITSLRELRDKYPLLTIDERLINRLLLEEASYNNVLLNILINKNQDITQNEKGRHVLIQILKRKIDDNLGIIFNLLHIIYPPEEYMEIYDYVIGPDQTLRNNAIEYLESTLGADIKKSIIPLIDYHVKKVGNVEATQQAISIQAMKEFLLNNRDVDIKNAAKNLFSAN